MSKGKRRQTPPNVHKNKYQQFSKAHAVMAAMQSEAYRDRRTQEIKDEEERRREQERPRFSSFGYSLRMISPLETALNPRDLYSNFYF